MNRQEIVRLSGEYGGAWLVGHAQRLPKLIAHIGVGLDYDAEAVWLAAWMHDWGVCPKWARKGVSHSRRSREVAGRYLARAGCPEGRMTRVLEAIEYHHGGAAGRSAEAVLLSDADALDSIGVLGVVKEFAMIPAEPSGDYCLPNTLYGLREPLERVRIRRENLPKLLQLARSRALARKRLREMDAVVAAIERDGLGCLQRAVGTTVRSCHGCRASRASLGAAT